MSISEQTEDIRTPQRNASECQPAAGSGSASSTDSSFTDDCEPRVCVPDWFEYFYGRSLTAA